VTCPPAGFTRLDGGHIRMPAGATPGSTRLLVAVMSGDDGDADDNLRLGAAANAQGIAVLYPTERVGSIWELDDAMGDADVIAVTGFLERTLATGCFDPNGVSITGVSNGAGFAARMACKLPTAVAAVVAVAGGYRALDRARRERARRSSPSTGPPTRRPGQRQEARPQGQRAALHRRLGAPRRLPDDAGDAAPPPLVTRLEFRGWPAGMRVEVLCLSGTDHGWPGAAPPWPKHNASGVDATLEVLRYVRQAVRPG
jgi:polyhydroxybutyrate depolymerase